MTLPGNHAAGQTISAADENAQDAAINTNTGAIAGKQDAATAATDAELASGLSTKQDAASAATDAELAAAILGVQSEIASMPYSVVTNATTTDTAIPGWQIVVPANSGPITVKLANMLWALITGTLAANSVLYIGIGIKDETNALVAYAKWQVIANGTSVTHVNTLSMEADLPNNVATKTYSVWIKSATTASSASATLHNSGSAFTDPQLKAIRR